jgi:hypothetical protein
MAYLKSLGVGTLALVLYLVLVPAISLLKPVVAGSVAMLLPKHTGPGGFRGSAYVGGSSFHLVSPLFLVLAGLVFVAGCYWEYHRVR